MSHTGFHLEVPGQEKTKIVSEIPPVLLREDHGGQKFLSVACESFSPQPDQDLVVVVEDQTILRAIDTKRVQIGS